jgi:PAS domain S-box-containing protein
LTIDHDLPHDEVEEEGHAPQTIPWSLINHYGSVGVGMALAVWGVNLLQLNPVGPQAATLLTVLVVLFSRLAGWGPTLLATAVGVAGLGWNLTIPPAPNWREIADVGLFLFVGVACALIVRAGEHPDREPEGLVADAEEEDDDEPTKDTAAELAAIIHHSDDPIITTDPACIIKSWNPAAERLFRYTTEEILGQPVDRLIPASYSHYTAELMQRVARGDHIKHYETVLANSQGAEVDVSLGVSPIKDIDNELIGISIIARDITERRRSERRQAAQHSISRMLAEAHTIREVAPRILKTLGEALGYPVGVFWASTRPSGKLRCLDAWHGPCPGVEEFVRMIRQMEYEQEGGLPGRVFSIRKPAWGSELSPDDDPHLAAANVVGLKGAVAFPVFRSEEVLGVIEFLQPVPTPTDPQALAMMAAVGSQIGQFVDREQTEGRLRQTEDQFRQAQKMEAVGQLAGGIAHDFNNLLTGILGYSDLVLLDLKPGDQHFEEHQEIHKAAERAALLTRQLLTFSRKQVLTPKVLDVNNIVAEAEKMLLRLIGEDIHLVTQLAPDLGRIKADPGQLEQVIINLAVNARDAMNAGGTLTIETSNAQLDAAFAETHPGIAPGRFVKLSVRDNGCGMDEATRARIFEPFFTTKEIGKGTGLALATVYGIVKQSGGVIEVESKPGEGTTFHIHLPRSDEVTPIRKSNQGLRKAPRGTETILLVEDEEVVRSLARTTLQNCGYSVLEANGAEEAIRLAHQHQGAIHLMLSDVVMPGMGGSRLSDRLRGVRPQMKVLFMSGYTDDSVLRHGVREKEVAFLQKPFTPLALANKVRERLDETAPGDP